MPPPQTNEEMEKIVSLCKRRGFIFQSSEIYGGLNGFWDYGPLGAELKRNIKEYWWKSMTQSRDDIVGLDATIIMHPKIWEASGHTQTFSDPMVDCLLTRKRFRADQIEPQTGTVYHFKGAVGFIAKPKGPGAVEGAPGPDEPSPELRGLLDQLRQQGRPVPPGSNVSTDQPYSVLVPSGKGSELSARKVAHQYYQQRGIPQPYALLDREEAVENSCRYNPENGGLLTEPRPFNLMFKTYVGPVESDDNLAYLRPETAQAIFAQFKTVLEVSRQKIPFGICQIGKAFRNEINPRNFTFRSREFEQMELEFFIRPDEVARELKSPDGVPGADGGLPRDAWGWQEWHDYWIQQRLEWYHRIGLGSESLELYRQPAKELAHYAKATVDILYKFPFGSQELEGIAARGDFDLKQHALFSGKSMEYYDEEAKKRYVPHVIEPSAGVDRLLLALVCQAYHEETVTDEKGAAEQRVVMRFHPRIAPIKAGVFPLLKNRPALVAKAREVRDMLRPHLSVFYDEAGAIGRRYRRQDEAGTPFGITIDFETLDRSSRTFETVTLRDRDSMLQERVKIADLAPLLLQKIA